MVLGDTVQKAEVKVALVAKQGTVCVCVFGRVHLRTCVSQFFVPCLSLIEEQFLS